MSRNNDDMCTACQTSYDPAESHCQEHQNGRKCYLDDQTENADTSIFEGLDLDELLSED